MKREQELQERVNDHVQHQNQSDDSCSRPREDEAECKDLGGTVQRLTATINVPGGDLVQKVKYTEGDRTSRGCWGEGALYTTISLFSIATRYPPFLFGVVRGPVSRGVGSSLGKNLGGTGQDGTTLI